MRFHVDPRDVPPHVAARRLGMSEAEFTAVLLKLQARGFPLADPDTGRFDLQAIDQWMDQRSALTAPAGPRDARVSGMARIASLRESRGN